MTFFLLSSSVRFVNTYVANCTTSSLNLFQLLFRRFCCIASFFIFQQKSFKHSEGFFGPLFFPHLLPASPKVAAAWWVFHYTMHSNFLPFSFSSTPYDCLDGRGEVRECEKSMKCLLWWPRHFVALPLTQMLALRTLQIILAYLMIDRHSWQLF